jgi:hypothetical protein
MTADLLGRWQIPPSPGQLAHACRPIGPGVVLDPLRNPLLTETPSDSAAARTFFSVSSFR